MENQENLLVQTSQVPRDRPNTILGENPTLSKPTQIDFSSQENIQNGENSTELINTFKNNFSLQDKFKQFKKERHEKFKYQQYLKNKKVTDRNNKEFQDVLRAKFVETAKKYMGVPYAKKYFKPEDPRYHSPIFLDCCGLVRQVVYDLREDFGFTLSRWNQGYQFDTLPNEVKFEDLKPGDLVFYSGTYYDPKKHQKQKHDMVHVEIFLGGETGEQTIGARWNNGVVSVFDSYKFTSKSYYDIKFYYRSIDTWLSGVCKSFCDQHKWVDDRNLWVPDKFSVFAEGDGAEGQDEEAVGNGNEEEEKVETSSKDETTVETKSKIKSVIVGAGNNDKMIKAYFARDGYQVLDKKMMFTKKYDIKWVQTVMEIDYLNFKEGTQIVNHIPNINILGTKNGLLQTFRDYEANHPEYTGIKLEEFMLPSFRLDILSDEILFFNHPSDGIWISKPNNTNQGKNIELIHDIKAFKDDFLQTKRFYLGEYLTTEIFDSKTTKIMNEKEQEKGNYKKIDNRVIVQKYLEKPLLLQNRKFDIRCYVLIASTKPLFALFNHGYCRLCLKEYSGELTETGFDKFAHLTNNSIQKKHPEYAKLKENTIWGMEKFENYLSETLSVSSDRIKSLYHEIKRILAYSIRTSQLKIDKKVGYFELLGCDIILDTDLKPYLLEINSNPALYCDTEPQQAVIPKVFNQTLDLVLELNKNPEKISDLVKEEKNLSLGDFEVIYNQETGFVYN